MSNFTILLTEIKSVLEATTGVNFVSHQKIPSLEQEDTFTSVYIQPTVDNFTPYIQGKALHSYDNNVYIRLLIHTNNTADELGYTVVREDIITAILDDKRIWSILVDRDIVSVVYDDANLYPLRSMEILFEFRIREDC